MVGPVNLGNPDELPVIDVARRVLALTGSRAGIEFHPLPVDDPRRRRPMIERARTLLGWQPEVGLDAGLQRTIARFHGPAGCARSRCGCPGWRRPRPPGPERARGPAVLALAARGVAR